MIRCENLTLGYEGRAVVTGLTFSVEEGDYLCIVGDNGSGKTTLIKTLLGLHSPMAGRLAIDLPDGIGYLPQRSTLRQETPASIWEVVTSGLLRRRGFSPVLKRAERERAEKALSAMGVAPLAKRPYAALSGGQQQRVLLARALCAADRLLLLDEPVAGLDQGATEEMYRLIHTLHQNGTTIIMVTHDPAACRYATRVLRLGENEHFFGSAAEYLTEGGNDA